MSVVALIIKLIKRKRTMNEEVEVTPTIQHPVLLTLNERVEVLTKANEELLAEVTTLKLKQ